MYIGDQFYVVSTLHECIVNVRQYEFKEPRIYQKARSLWRERKVVEEVFVWKHEERETERELITTTDKKERGDGILHKERNLQHRGMYLGKRRSRHK